MSDHPKVIRGKEGYLFLAGDQNAVIKQHSGEILLERTRLKRWRNLFIGRKKILDSLSCHYYVQIVPDKHCIYRQYLPDKFKISEIQNVDLVLSYIKPILGNRVSFPLAQLVEKSQQEQVYHKTDSHWTDKGSYIAYCELMKLIHHDYPDIEIIKNPHYQLREFTGDLARLIELNHNNKIEFLTRPEGVDISFDNHAKNTGRIRIYENHQIKNNFTAVIFGSSSTNNLIYLLSLIAWLRTLCWSG